MKKNRMFQATLVGCATVASVGFFACNSSTTTMTTEDSGADSSPGTEASTNDVTTKDSATKDRSVSDVSSSDTTTPTDARPEATEAEAAAPASCVPLNLCDTFDQIFGIVPDGGEPAICATETTGACGVPGSSREDTWGTAVVDAFGGGVAGTDCNIDALFNTTESGGLLTDDEQNNYPNQLTAFALSFLGCPIVTSSGDGGAEAGAPPLPPFGLIPIGITSLTYTTADLNLLSAYWSQAIQNAVVTNFEINGGPVSSLTGEQIIAINAALACQVSITAGVVNSSRYNHNVCSDGGSDGGRD
jgi:hypothetical protein